MSDPILLVIISLILFCILGVAICTIIDLYQQIIEMFKHKNDESKRG